MDQGDLRRLPGLRLEQGFQNRRTNRISVCIQTCSVVCVGTNAYARSMGFPSFSFQARCVPGWLDGPVGETQINRPDQKRELSFFFSPELLCLLLHCLRLPQTHSLTVGLAEPRRLRSVYAAYGKLATMAGLSSLYGEIWPCREKPG